MSSLTFTDRVRARLKSWVLGGDSPWYLGDSGWGARYQGTIDYQAEAGPPDTNAIVVACLNWVATTFPEAPLRVTRTGGTTPQSVANHALLQLVNTPNEWYTGLDLWAATLFDYNICGNGYWLAPLNRGGRPVELWYEPHFSIQAKGSAEKFIDHWEIYRGGYWIELDPRETRVIHFRRGIDPSNPHRGLSPLLAAYREIFTDNEAARWAATLLRNTGIPGVIIAPKEGELDTDPEVIKQKYMNKFTGDKRGEPMVMTGPTNVFKLDWSPAEMDLTAIRRLPEERISALLGVPAVVAGLGAGLDRSTYSNMSQARAQGWEDNLSPTQRRAAATLQADLLPLLGNPATESVSFDTSQVKALQDDQDALYARLTTGYQGGWLLRGEARRAAGWPEAPDGSDNVFKDAAAPPAFTPLKGVDRMIALIKGQYGGTLPEHVEARLREGYKSMVAESWEQSLRELGGPLTPELFARTDLLPGERKALEAVLERRFRRDVQSVLDGLYREALADVPDGKALVTHRNGAHDAD